MHIKSLLIGSAAALVAAPAFAADVIIAEPEPVEYVEVCDVAGAGYFYIPGSRTCIQISGLVRHELSFQETNEGLNAANDFTRTATGPNGFNGPTAITFQGDDAFLFTEPGNGRGINSLVRAELRVRTFTETELGDLTSDLRFRANSINADGGVAVRNSETGELNAQGVSRNDDAFLQNATIGLGGLLLGLTDTLYDGGINGEFDAFGGDRVHTIRYTADLGAFSASIGLEAERETGSRLDFVPNVVANVSGDIGAFSVDLWAAYDDEEELEFFITDAVDGVDFLGAATGDVVPGAIISRGESVIGDDEFSLKARLGADVGIAEVQVGATYNSGRNTYDNGYEYSIGASAKVGLGEKASLTFGGQYFANFLAANAFNDAAGRLVVDNATTGVLVGGTGTEAIDDADGFTIGANVDYEIVDGFDVKVAVNYVDLDTGALVATGVDGAGFGTGFAERTIDEDGFFNGFIRFDRSF